MSDLISRQAAIDAFDSYILDETTDLNGNTVREVLEKMPSAQRWIPVSERLPEKGERVLATVNFNVPFVCEIDYWEDAKKAEWDMEQMNFVESITAWMPLPNPYKGEER